MQWTVLFVLCVRTSRKNQQQQQCSTSRIQKERSARINRVNHKRLKFEEEKKNIVDLANCFEVLLQLAKFLFVPCSEFGIIFV
jgi:hypothetical protein